MFSSSKTPKEILSSKFIGTSLVHSFISVFHFSPLSCCDFSLLCNCVTALLTGTVHSLCVCRNEGWYGFYKGLTPSLLRVVPACCITFVVYETMIEHLMRDTYKMQKLVDSWCTVGVRAWPTSSEQYPAEGFSAWKSVHQILMLFAQFYVSRAHHNQTVTWQRTIQQQLSLMGAT